MRIIARMTKKQFEVLYQCIVQSFIFLSKGPWNTKVSTKNVPLNMSGQICPPKYVRLNMSHPKYVPLHLCPIRPKYVPAHLCPMPFMSHMTQICPTHLCPAPFMSHSITNLLAQICPGPFMSQYQNYWFRTKRFNHMDQICPGPFMSWPIYVPMP